MNEALALSGLRVLAVDDEADARELVTTILIGFGAEVKAAGSAEETNGDSEPLAPRRFDFRHRDARAGWLFVNPGSQKYRKPKWRADSGDRTDRHARTEDRQRALQAGFQIHISKPISPRELKTILLGLTGRTEDKATTQHAPQAVG